MKNDQGIADLLDQPDLWQQFLDYKIKRQHLKGEEEKQIRLYIEERRFEDNKKKIVEGAFPGEYPLKRIVNKEGTSKKRVVYSFGRDVSITLKFIASQLYKYDDYFASNCYAFRRNTKAGDALKRVLQNPGFSKKYCYKADISNYFNSINVELLIEKLGFLKERDEVIYELFRKILTEENVKENGCIRKEKHGAMAGLPIAPFFANVYLADMDRYFLEKGIAYFRYSDDILIFADTKEELEQYKGLLPEMLKSCGLCINSSKESISKPGETWEFLGFSYNGGKLDLSQNTKRKIKAKIKRKAESLRRWQRKKNLPPDKAAIGFIRAMNRKFYGYEDNDDFTWNRWFFPYLTVDTGLREVDHYMQEYIRYIITGRHYKGNYRITYDRMKEWGYRSLVHEYYQFREGKNYGTIGKDNIGVRLSAPEGIV